MIQQIQNIASLSMRGGRNDNFYFTLIEYYPESDRWFLKSLLPVKEEEAVNQDEAIRAWIDSFQITDLVLDIPQSRPACYHCELDCPGAESCEVTSVKETRRQIKNLLNEDQKLLASNPKKYEQERNLADEIVFNRSLFDKETHTHLLSRSFKRRLKKGFIPYWNRPIDFYLWKYYYDPILELFKTSYDSFGNTSLMTLSRFNYIKRHFPKSVHLHEANQQIVLLELLRSKHLLRKDIELINDIELGFETRLELIKKIESHLNIFIYSHDLEILVKKPQAFDSFLLALAGQNYLLNKNIIMPQWAYPDETRFIIPQF